MVSVSDPGKNFSICLVLFGCILVGISDRDFDYARRFPAKASTDADDFALEALDGPSYLADSKCELIPIDDPTVLADSAFFKDLFKEEEKLKMQHEFTKISSRFCFNSFLKHSLSHHAYTSDKTIQSLDPPGSSLLPNLFTAKKKLTQKHLE